MRVTGGGTVENNDFQFQLYLICDDELRPDDANHYSDLAGLRIYARWQYDGPRQQGEFRGRYGFEPEVRLVSGFSILDSHASAEYSQGLVLPSQEQVPELAASGEPVTFTLQVNTNEALYGASLSFRLAAAADGYISSDIQVQTLPVQPIESAAAKAHMKRS